MSKLAVGLMAALVVSTSLVAAASAQDRVLAGTGPANRPMPCGAPLTGEAPDVMTYDRATGTQVFVGGKGRPRSAPSTATPARRPPCAATSARPASPKSCAVDRVSGDAYRVSSRGPGDMQVTGRTGETGERWSFRAPGRLDPVLGPARRQPLLP